MTPEELIKLKQDLDAASDKLKDKINVFKDDLKKLQLGVESWAKLSENTSIGYARYKSEWEVLISFDDFGVHEVRPIMECPRTLRVYGYKNRLKLVEALENSAKSLLEHLNKVIEE